jgi:SutA RNAP-binding domain
MVYRHHYRMYIQMQTEPKKVSKSKTNSNVAKVTSQLIAEQTTAFLKAGGKIKKIRSGVRDQEAVNARAQTDS